MSFDVKHTLLSLFDLSGLPCQVFEEYYSFFNSTQPLLLEQYQLFDHLFINNYNNIEFIKAYMKHCKKKEVRGSLGTTVYFIIIGRHLITCILN